MRQERGGRSGEGSKVRALGKEWFGVGRTWTGTQAAAGRTGLKRRTSMVSHFML